MIQSSEVSAERSDLCTVHQHCPDRPYLELTVPNNSVSVTFIKFKISSRDQGWADQDGVNRSTTWFDAAARRPPNRSSLPNFTLFCNARGVPEFQSQTAGWDVKSTLAKRNWLAALLPGDVIQIIPRAKFQGWVNIVGEAHITNTSDEIRVLHLQPAVDHDDPLLCSLHHLRLGQGGDFEPLSYCWGDADEMEEITIDAEAVGGVLRAIPVAQSIAKALRELRLPHKPRRLWIDQLCINQNDRKEKTQQVGLMARVYSEASMVHIWLGLGDRATQAALAVVRDIYNYDRETFCIGGEGCGCEGTQHFVRLHDLKKRSRNRREGSRVFYEGLGDIFKVHMKTWPAEIRQSASGLKGSPNLSQLLSCLFSNPWFRRVWVIQEALCPPRAVVRCGPEIVPWDEVLHANHILSSIDFAASQPYSLAPAVTMPWVWNVLRENLRENHPSPNCVSCAEGPMCILCVFLHGLSLQATVPQDKLFALLSFDYSTPIEVTMANFTRWWILTYQSLDILSWTHCQPGRTWRRTSHDSHKPELSAPTWSLGVDGKYTWGEATLLNEHRHDATNGAIPDQDLVTLPISVDGGGVEDDQSRLQLRLRGYQITEIEEITYLALDNHIPTATRKNSDKKISRTNSNDDDKKLDKSQQQLEDYMMTKPAASLLRSFDRTFDPTDTFKFWNSWWPQSSRPHDQRPRERILHRLREPAGPMSDHISAHTRYYSQRTATEEAYSFAALAEHASAPLVRCSADICPSCLDPFFFVGSDGRKTKGLCPWPARVGDVVVVLSGGKVPYLLRPVPNKEDYPKEKSKASFSDETAASFHTETAGQSQDGQKYQFVGECFVMGAMSGRYYEKQIREGRELSIYTLV
ncbi:hypothetical protein PG989_006415 [Apiospora arundinis]